MSKQENDGVEFAWRVHDSIGEWTGKVDSKASIVLALEAAAVGFVVTLSDHSGPLAHLSKGSLLLYRIGVSVLCLSAVLAALVVFPQLNRWKSRRHWKDGVIFFGHLKRWTPESLEGRLKTADDASQLKYLSDQLVATSKVAWRKHSLLQFSMLTLFVGGSLILLAKL